MGQHRAVDLPHIEAEFRHLNASRAIDEIAVDGVDVYVPRGMILRGDRTDVAKFAMRLRIFYFLYFAAVGVYYPFLVPHLRGIGLGGSEIGTAQMASSVAAIPASFLWGALADRLRAPARALRLATRGALVTGALLIVARTPLTVTLVLLAHGLVAPAIVPLVDTVAVESIRDRPEASYSRLRLFGSLGFIASAQGLGLVLASFALRARTFVMPVAYVCALLLAVLSASMIPIMASESRPKPHLGEVRALLGDRRLVIFLAAGAVHAATTATYQLYGVLVHDHGFSPAVTGAGMAFGVVAEVLVLFAFPVLERRFSIGTLLSAAFAASTIRWWLLSYDLSAAWLVIIQGFHGLTFGLYWAAAIKVMSLLVPARFRATGQALYSSVTSSLGGALGYRFAGHGYQHFGGAGPVYAWASVVELAALALALRLRTFKTSSPGVLERGPREKT